MKIWMAGLLAFSLCAPVWADDLKLTKAQEDLANELGAVASPVAFLSACNEASTPLAGEMAKEYEKLTKDEKETFAVLRSLTQQFCAGMISATATTVMADQDYTVQGEKICIDPRQSVDGILIKMNDIAKSEPNVFHDKEVTTPMFILYAIKKLGGCQ